MQKAVFPILGHADITKAISFIHTNYTKALEENKPLVVRIDQKQDDRTVAQNRLYWLQLNQLRKQTGNSADHLHFTFKRMFLARILARDDQGYAEMCKAVKALKTEQPDQYAVIAKQVTRLTSTTVLNTKQFSEYLERIEDYAMAKLNIVLIWPDDLMYLKSE